MLKKGRILSEKKCFAFDCKGNLEIISVFVVMDFEMKLIISNFTLVSSMLLFLKNV